MAKRKAGSKRRTGTQKRLVRAHLEEAQWRRVVSLARREGKSASAVVRQAVVRYLEGWRD